MQSLTTDEIIQLGNSRFHLYNNFGFLRQVPANEIVDATVVKPLRHCLDQNECITVHIEIERHNHIFIVKELVWDGQYFGFPCFSIENIFFSHSDSEILSKALAQFVTRHLMPKAYYTINIASEDLILLRAICNTGFQLVESRLNYAHKIMPAMPVIEFSDIELASQEDVETLKKVAARMRNPFDRVHSDPAFSDETADAYLAKFIEESIKGYADIVLKVSDSNGTPFGFLAGNLARDICGQKVSRLVLAAVDSSVQKGRLEDLLNVMLSRLNQSGSGYLTTITQTSNIPAVRTWEKTRFTMFKATHLFSCKT